MLKAEVVDTDSGLWQYIDGSNLDECPEYGEVLN